MLKPVMNANALSCLGFGTIFLAMPDAAAGFLGTPPTVLIWVVGAGLVLNGLHLVIAARRTPLRRAEVLYFATGDAAWVAGSLGLVLSGVWIEGPGATAATLLVAAWVGACGLAQVRLAPPVREAWDRT